MEQILVIDRDPIHRSALTEALGRYSRSTLACVCLEEALSAIERQAFTLIIVVAHARVDWYADVDIIRHAALRQLHPPQIVCLLRGPYRGPTEQVYAARRGFRVVYEQR